MAKIQCPHCQTINEAMSLNDICQKCGTIMGAPLTALDTGKDAPSSSPEKGEVSAEERVVGVLRIDSATHVVGGAGDRDDARRRGVQQRGHQLRGEGPVAEMIDAELGLESVGGATLRRRHQAGVVDEDVDGSVLGDDVRCG